MDLSATLTPAEVEALSNYDTRTLQDAARIFERTTATSGHRSESAFETSLRIKNSLDVFEDTTRTAASGHVLAVLMNCEYQLRRLNVATPLGHNPFLSHWVEAVQRLDRPDRHGEGTSAASDALSAEKITAIRVLWIKLLLKEQDVARWLEGTPLEVSGALLRNMLDKPFDLQPYIRMLEDEGIYEKTPEPEAVAAASSDQPGLSNHDAGLPTRANMVEHSFEDSVEKHKEDILHNLKQQPDTAIFEITRLPITITYLDFLTTILSNRTLEKHSIDPAPVITQYIQHALRTVERMDKPPSPSSELDAEWSAELSAQREMMEYGKEAQSRHILLLLLFIKSLIRKGLIELDVLFYEIAEITVRYVWIKEVREFRTWAEEGIEQESG